MLIRNFDDIDIPEASQLAKLTWGDFYTEESLPLQNLIYRFMVEYYDLNREYSFSVIDDGLKGFLLAFTKNDSKNLVQNFKNKVQNLKSTKEQKTALDLFNYLEACGKEVKNIMTPKDVMLGLFVSVQKGCGRMLLSKLGEICMKKEIKNIYLWTDTTCDYKYYQKNKFKLVSELETLVNDKQIKTLIYCKPVL